MKVAYQILVIFGSLGVFLFGMRLLSEGLQKATGTRLKQVLGFMTANRFAGVASGFVTTSVIQSSSATTVMVVGFVDAQLLTLRQAIGVIMGANIGTTVTGWIVALLGFRFDVTAAALPAIAVGTAVVLIKRIEREEIGEIMLGFGLLFLGLGLLKESVPDIRNNPQALEFLTRFTGRGLLSCIVFIIAGAVITVIVQSSSAAMAITLTMTFLGWIDFPTSAAVILGENIGTTVTAYLASINAGANARRAARAHTLFNLFGVVWMVIVFSPFLRLVDLIVPGDATGRAAITSHLAMFHTLFNLVNTMLCIGFVRGIERLVNFLVPERASDAPAAYHFPRISSAIGETTELVIVAAQAEIAKMAGTVEELFCWFRAFFDDPNKEIRAQRKLYERKLERVLDMREQIAAFLVESSREPMSEQLATTVNALVRVVTELESIADTCQKLIRLARQKYEKKIVIDGSLVEAIRPYAQTVERFLEFNANHLRSRLTEADFREAAQMESSINQMQKELKRAARRRIRRGGSVKAELFVIDVLKHIEHIGDFSLALSEALKVIR